ncbi:MAG TPA: type II secretion system F family protein [Mycobacteriales bacterium]|nr:type II secretion system F family protein [Mycobacteriales bacterium]
MTALGLGLCGAAVLAAPAAGPGTSRMRTLSDYFGPPRDSPRARLGVPPSRVSPRNRPSGAPKVRTILGAAGYRARPVPVGAAATLPAMLAAGPAIGMAVGVAAAASAWLLRDRARTRRTRRQVDAMLEAVTALTGELRAGGTPEAALRSAAGVAASTEGPRSAADPDPGAARALSTAAATASLGGDVAAAVRAAAGECQPELGTSLRRVAAGWGVSERSGASLGTVLDRVECDLRSRRRQARQVEAQLAGPRATGAMLALLPGFGLLLGTAMGANPVMVLVGTGPGRLALLTGVGLDALGALWTARLLRVGDR